ncbi:MAG: PqqD family protein [Pseudomonadota bacterium]
MNSYHTETDTFQSVDEVTWRDIKGELVVLELASGEYYSFNEIGRLSWISLTQGKSVKVIIDEIVNEYDVTHDQAKEDLDGFITGLLENNLIVRLK